MSLTDADREALLTPCGCGHTINDHGSLVACWRCDDENGACATGFEDLLAERIEAIVARHVEAALNEAADEIDDNTRRYMFMAENRMRGFKERDEAYGAQVASENAVRIVHTAAKSGP